MIRAATPADLSAIMAIERASFPDDAWSEAMMSAELESEHGVYLVVEEAGRIVGYGGLRAPSGAPDADIQTIALADAARGRGRGRTLLRALLDAAAPRDVFLDVRDDNPAARSLYESEGFVAIDRRPRYYPGGVDAVVMRLESAARVLHRDASRGEGVSREEGGSDGAAPRSAASPSFGMGPPLLAPGFVMIPTAGAPVCGPDGCS